MWFTRCLVAGLVALSITGCGSVDALRMDDAGTGGAGGQGGVGDTGGAPGTGGVAQLDGSAGSLGQDASPPDAGCTPTACTTCVNGASVPVADGTSCGGGLCDGVPAFYGQYSCVATNYTCMAGVCTTATVDCCAKLGCPGGDSACTGNAENNLNSPTMCTTVCVAR